MRHQSQVTGWLELPPEAEVQGSIPGDFACENFCEVAAEIRWRWPRCYLGWVFVWAEGAG